MQGENPLCNIQYATVRMSLTFELIQVYSLVVFKCISIEFHQKFNSILNIPPLAVIHVNSS